MRSFVAAFFGHVRSAHTKKWYHVNTSGYRTVAQPSNVYYSPTLLAYRFVLPPEAMISDNEDVVMRAAPPCKQTQKRVRDVVMRSIKRSLLSTPRPKRRKVKGGSDVVTIRDSMRYNMSFFPFSVFLLLFCLSAGFDKLIALQQVAVL